MSSTIGESVGSPTQLSPRQLETTAAAEVAKAAMKIVSDTVDLNFFLLDEGVRKYQSPASRPNLTSPLSSVRMGNLPPTADDQSWQAVYEQLKNNLPENLQQMLALTLQLPADQQGANVMVLNSLLQSAAMGLVLLSTAASGVEADSLPAARAESNLAAPFMALATSVFVNRALLGEALNVLSLVGPNDPNFSAVAGYMGQFSTIALDVEEAAKVLQNSQTFDAGLSQIGEAAIAIASLRRNFDTLYGGGELLLLGAMLSASADVTAALTLESKGAASLLLSLAMASSGMDDSKSALATSGEPLSATLNGVAAALGTLFVPAGDVGSQLVLERLVTAALTAAVLFGSMTYAQGLPISGSDADPEVRAEKGFAYSLALTMLSQMGVLSTIAAGVASATNLPAESQEKIGALLSSAAMALLIAAAAKERGDAEDVKPLIADQRDNLRKGVETAAELVSDALNRGKVQGEDWETGNVFLQQTLIALNDNDGEAFLGALNSLLGLVGTSNEKLLGDMAAVSEFGKGTSLLLHTSADEAGGNFATIYSPA